MPWVHRSRRKRKLRVLFSLLYLCLVLYLAAYGIPISIASRFF